MIGWGEEYTLLQQTGKVLHRVSFCNVVYRMFRTTASGIFSQKRRARLRTCQVMLAV